MLTGVAGETETGALDADRRIEQAATLIDLRRYDDALGCLGPVLAATPDDGDAHVLASRAHLRAGRADRAWSHAATAARLDPRSLEARVALAFALADRGNPTQAAVEAEEAIRLAPWHPAGHVALTAAGMNQKAHTARTRAAAREALAPGPHDADLHVLAAQSHMYNGRPWVRRSDRRAARGLLGQALELEPGHLGARAELATLQAMGASPFASLRGHATVLREDPHHTESHERITFALKRLPFFAHFASWFVWLALGRLLSVTGGSRNVGTSVLGAAALAIVVVVAVRLRLVLGRALVPTLRAWAREDPIGAVWLGLLVVINATTLTTAVDPAGVGPAVHRLGFWVLLLAVALSWARGRKRT